MTADNATQDDAAAINYVMGDGTERSPFYAGEEIIIVGAPIDAAYEDGDELVTLRQIESTESGTITNSRSEGTLEIENDFTEIPVEASDITTPTGETPVAFVRIEDEHLDAGDYYIRDTDRRIAETERNSVEIAVQRFAATWDEETVEIGAAETAFPLEVDSQRSTYNVNVSADGLEYEELEALFLDTDNEDDDRLKRNAPRANRAPFTDASGNPLTGVGLDSRLEKASAFEEDDVIVLRGTNNDALYANVSNLEVDPATFEFELSVVDSGVEATAPLTIEDSEADADFDHRIYERAAGDVIDVTVDLEETDETYLVFGDSESGYLDIIFLEDDTGDGTVEFTINSRLVGTLPRMDATGGDNAFTSNSDTVVSLAANNNHRPPGEVTDVFAGVRLEAENGVAASTGNAVPGTDGSLNAIRDELDHRPIVRPLQPATYEMRLTSDGVVGLSERGGIRVDNEHDLALVDLEEPSLESATVYTAPTDTSDAVSLTELRRQMTPRETVAIGDRLAFELEASGYLGQMIGMKTDDGTVVRNVIENGTTTQGLHRIDADRIDGMTFRFESNTPAANQAPKRLTFDTDDTEEAKVFVDPDTQNLFVVLDTRAELFNQHLRDGDVFTLRMAYPTADDARYRFAETVDRGDFDSFAPFAGSAGGYGDRQTYPYLPPGTEQVIEAEVTFETPAIRFDRTTERGGTVRLGAGPTAVISGETNLSPGSMIELRVFSDAAPSIAQVSEAEVQTDGRFSAEIDTTGAERGQAFTIETRHSGRTIEDRRGTVTDDRVGLSFNNHAGSQRIDAVEVDAFLPDGGFIAIYNETFLEDHSADAIRGVSEFLIAGGNTDVTIALDEPFERNTTAVAVLHRDTNENREFDFVTTDGSEDNPYFSPDGNPIADDATITIEASDPTPTPTPTATATPTATVTPDSDTPMPTATPSPTDPVDQTLSRGLSVLVVLGAIVLAAYRGRRP